MKQLAKAAATLKQGGLVIFPTETVYALGCLLSNDSAIKNLYNLKGRDLSQPTSVIVSDIKMAKQYVEFTQLAEILAKHFWPGPLTLCLKANRLVTKLVLGNGDKLALRVPGESFAKDLVDAVNEPILVPSANFKGQEAPAVYNMIDKELADKVNYVVNIEPGGVLPSTIVEIDTNDRYKVIREGQIKAQSIEQVLQREYI